MKKRIICSLLLVAILMGSFSVFSDGISLSESTSIDDQEKLQLQWESINYNSVSTEKEKAVNTAESFLTLMGKDLSGTVVTNKKYLISQTAQNSKNIEYFENKCLNQFPANELKSFQRNVNVVSIEVNGNSANVSLQEEITYVLDDGNNVESWQRITYTVDMIREDNLWKIRYISSDSSEDRAAEASNYIATNTVNVGPPATSHEYMLQCEEMIVNGTLGDTTRASSLAQTTYDRTKAGNYAATYAKNYNSRFPSFAGSGGDCQNFASQCVYAGFGGANTATAINGRSYPMITSPSNRIWYCNPSSSSASWTSCSSFYNYLQGSSSSVRGPQGAQYTTNAINSRTLTSSYQDNLKYASVGDVIHFYWSNGGRHAMVVTKVTGTFALRTADNIWVSGHTTDESDVLLRTKLENNNGPKYTLNRIVYCYN